MAETKWTKDQQLVIDLRDRNILVAAAAGSGKTAVLVERIIEEITEEKKPKDIDKLLVVTFTKAAAAEMQPLLYTQTPAFVKPFCRFFLDSFTNKPPRPVFRGRPAEKCRRRNFSPVWTCNFLPYMI